MDREKEVVVVEAVRSAVGKRNGSLSGCPAPELLADVLRALVVRAGIDPASVGQVIGGTVTQVGAQSSNVTRNAWLSAGLPLEVPAVTVTAQCGSSQEAVTIAHGLVGSGLVDVAIACGVETMTAVPPNANVPSGPDGPTFGVPRGGRFLDHYEATTQFEAAERIAERWHLGRSDLDRFGQQSQERAARAWAEGRFASQIVPVEVPVLDAEGKVSGHKVFERDEGLRPTTAEGLAGLRPNPRSADRRSLHTAGTSSQISDGAAAVLLMSAPAAARAGVAPRARLVHSVLVGSDPVLMLTGPIPATDALLARTGIGLADIDLFEVNEAFASVALAWQHETGADPDRVNVNGGAIAIGHPLGATGALLVTKMVHELERRRDRYGLVAMCCGGGLGTGTLLERA